MTLELNKPPEGMKETSIDGVYIQQSVEKLPLDNFLNDILHRIELDLNKGWASTEPQIATPLHDVLLSLRHWKDDVYNQRDDVLKALEGHNTALAQALRLCLDAIAKSLSHLRTFHKDGGYKESPGIHTVLIQEVGNCVECLKVQVGPLHAFAQAMASLGDHTSKVTASWQGQTREQGHNIVSEDEKDEQRSPPPGDDQPSQQSETIGLEGIELSEDEPPLPLHEPTHGEREGLRMNLMARLEMSALMFNSKSRQRGLYVPESVLQSLITPDTIKAELSLERVPILPGLIAFIHTEAMRTFAILVCCRRTQAITLFYEDRFTDSRLPINDSADSETGILTQDTQFKRVIGSAITQGTYYPSDLSYLHDSFFHYQWLFTAPVFQRGKFDYDFPERTILPFCAVEGGEFERFGTVSRFRIHPAHQKVLESVNGQEPVVAVKKIKDGTSYKDKSRLDKMYKRQMETLRMMQKLSDPHMIDVVAEFNRGDETFLMYRWAEGGNLRDLWQREDPGSPDASTITWVIDQLWGVSRAILKLHNLKIVQNCRHGNLKPENILNFTGLETRGSLVVADPGSGVYSNTGRNEGTDLAVTMDERLRYAPPNVPIDVETTCAYDIWSMGCIFLEFIVWLLYGHTGLQGFNDRFQGPFWKVPSGTSGSKVACIHEEVQRWITWMQVNEPRTKKGIALGDLLSLVQTRLLVAKTKQDGGEVETRAQAKELFERMTSIRAKVTPNSPYLLECAKAQFHVSTPNDESTYAEEMSRRAVEGRRKELGSITFNPDITSYSLNTMGGIAALVKTFKSKRIPVYEPGELEYDRAIATSNLLFRFSRPDCVVQPETAAHVQTIIKEAKSKKLKITIKCAGHSYAGHSTAFQGISLDLRRMKNVKLDLKSRTVTMDSGCQWGDVYKTLINDRHNGNGFIINGGRCPPVGVSGFIMGGGLGPFTRSFGMGSDTLMEATVVTAAGEKVTVNEKYPRDSNEGKLFWALRGAGGGNFGVLVSMKLRVQELQNRDRVVVAGRYQWFPDAEGIKSLIPTMNSFYTTNWPNQMTIDSTWLCDLRQNTGDGIRFLTYFDGNKYQFDNLIDKYIKHPDLAKQLKRRSLPEESTRFLHETLVAQWSEETVRSFPTNKTYSIYSSFVFTNDKNTIEKLTAIIKKEMETFRRLYSGEKVEFLVTWIHSGGKAMEKHPSDTAFFWREALYQTYVTVEWEDKWMERDMRGFLGKVKEELRPYSLNKEAAFINFSDGILAKNAYERAYFGENRQELRRVKEIWDRDNFFRWDQGIQLPQGADDDPNANVDMPNDESFTDTIAAEQWEVFESKDVTARFVEKVDELVKDFPIERFFEGKEDFIQEVAKNAVELEKDTSTSLGSPELLPKTIKVSLHQQVIYCDDSSSMKRENRWESQKNLVERIAKITTRVLPKDEGVALRFINQEVPNSSNLRLGDIENILKPMKWDPYGNTDIGTNMRSKILKPLVYDKLDSVPKSLERPLLISILTDGGPEPEAKDMLKNAIIECSKKLNDAKYPRESVKFMIGQIGTSDRATKFLDTIRGNTEIADMVFCTSDQLDDRFKKEHENEGKLDRWLIETLFEPLKDRKKKLEQ